MFPTSQDRRPDQICKNTGTGSTRPARSWSSRAQWSGRSTQTSIEQRLLLASTRGAYAMGVALPVDTVKNFMQ